MDISWQAALSRLGQHNKTLCPRCGQRLVRGARLARSFARNENSIFKAVPSGFAQHGVQADTPNVLWLTGTGPPHVSDIFLSGGVQLN